MGEDGAGSPGDRYRAAVASGRWQSDPAQHAALDEFDRLYAALTTSGGGNFWQRLGLARRDAIPGLYLHGEVGRGKTMLMDLLVESLSETMVLRSHFHHFMQDVHESLRGMPRQQDPLDRIAAAMARRARVLCLDEFQVIDIGDAMLLAGLLRALLRERVSLVATSNTAPADLYRDGLQRARFLPAIKLIQRHCHVVALRSPTDWRLRALEQAPLYHVPPGAEAVREMSRLFDRYAHGPAQEGGVLEVCGRQIPLRRATADMAWFDFSALCEGPRSVADYLELAARCRVLLVSRVPQFGPDTDDAARRFINLVDAMYDHRVKLVLSAAAPIVELYDGKRLRDAFARTESRLIEMQSRAYLETEPRRDSAID